MRASAVVAGIVQPPPIAPRFIGASASGLGDGTLRIKGQLVSRSGESRTGVPRSAGVALAVDVRLPIGDELNYHGTGAYGIKPFVIASATLGRFTPHLNAGYQYNGTSYLASRYANRKGQLSGIWTYAVGLDVGMSERVTLAGEVLSQIVVSGPSKNLI